MKMKQEYKYLNHSISMNVVESIWGSDDLTQYMNDGWRIYSHDVFCKHGNICHSWVLYRHVQAEKTTPIEDVEKQMKMAMDAAGRIFAVMEDSLSAPVGNNDDYDDDFDDDDEEENVVEIPIAIPMTFEQGVKAGLSGEALKKLGDVVAVREAGETYNSIVRVPVLGAKNNQPHVVTLPKLVAVA
jgi:hypothetical protein